MNGKRNGRSSTSWTDPAAEGAASRRDRHRLIAGDPSRFRHRVGRPRPVRSGRSAGIDATGGTAILRLDGDPARSDEADQHPRQEHNAEI